MAGLCAGGGRRRAVGGGSARRAALVPTALLPWPLAPSRFRHLMLDLGQLLPHSKRDAKLDTKSERGVINEVADLKVRWGGAAEEGL